MKKERFTEEQIIGVLKQHEAGPKVPELVREMGGERGADLHVEVEVRRDGVSEAQRLKSLEDENRRRTHPVAYLSVNKEGTEGDRAKKRVTKIVGHSRRRIA